MKGCILNRPTWISLQSGLKNLESQIFRGKLSETKELKKQNLEENVRVILKFILDKYIRVQNIMYRVASRQE
jgi:hypothetical protein